MLKQCGYLIGMQLKAFVVRELKFSKKYPHIIEYEEREERTLELDNKEAKESSAKIGASSSEKVDNNEEKEISEIKENKVDSSCNALSESSGKDEKNAEISKQEMAERLFEKDEKGEYLATILKSLQTLPWKRYDVVFSQWYA